MSLSKFQAGCLLFSALGLSLGTAYYCYQQEAKAATNYGQEGIEFNKSSAEMINSRADRIAANIEEIKQRAPPEVSSGLLTKRTLELYYETLDLITRSDIQKAIDDNRSRRRHVMDDLAVYQAVILEIDAHFQKITIDASMKLASVLQVPVPLVMDSKSELAKIDPEVAKIPEKYLFRVEEDIDKDCITKAKAIEILDYQLAKKAEILSDPNYASLPKHIKSYLIKDYSFIKYGVENSVLYKWSQSETSPEIQEKFNRVKMA